MAKTKLQKKRICDRGNAIFESKIKPLVKAIDPEWFVAIDIKSGEFAVAADSLDAFDQLEARVAKPQTFFRKVGSPYAVKFGGHRIRSLK